MTAYLCKYASDNVGNDETVGTGSIQRTVEITGDIICGL